MNSLKFKNRFERLKKQNKEYEFIISQLLKSTNSQQLYQFVPDKIPLLARLVREQTEKEIVET